MYSLTLSYWVLTTALCKAEDRRHCPHFPCKETMVYGPTTSKSIIKVHTSLSPHITGQTISLPKACIHHTTTRLFSACAVSNMQRQATRKLSPIPAVWTLTLRLKLNKGIKDRRLEWSQEVTAQAIANTSNEWSLAIFQHCICWLIIWNSESIFLL